MKLRAALLFLGVASCAIPDRVQVTPELEHGTPRVLCIFAHPDDETTVAGAIFKTATHLGGRVDMLLVTNGEGGFKYSTLAERMYGLELTREDVGREHLPRIRREEMLEGCELLGVHQVHFCGEWDHRYSQDPDEVLGEGAEVWDLEKIEARIAEHLDATDYDFVLTMAPSPTTHGHHQAVTVLTARALAARPEHKRPIGLGVSVESDTSGLPTLPAALVNYPETTMKAGPALVFDRTQPFGHRERLDYRVVVNFLIAAHRSQGTMQLAMSKGLREHYFLFDSAPSGAEERASEWMAALAEDQFPVRQYGASAGTNAGNQ